MYLFWMDEFGSDAALSRRFLQTHVYTGTPHESHTTAGAGGARFGRSTFLAGLLK